MLPRLDRPCFERADQLDAALAEAFDHDGPALVHVVSDALLV